MPSAGAFAITARTSARVTSVAERGGAADWDEVTACDTTNSSPKKPSAVCLMSSPCGGLLYAHDSVGPAMRLATLQAMCRSCPGATQDVKWGHDLCFSVGGRMFAAVN